MSQSELGGIALQRVHLSLGHRILYGFVLVVGRSIVVRHTHYPFRTETAYAPLPEGVKSLRAGHFVAIEPVDVKLHRTVFHL